MYKLLKNHKDLTNQHVLGKTSKIERFEKQMLLINFYDTNLNFSNENFSVYQQYFILKSFLQENLISKKILEKKVLNKALANKHAYLLEEEFLFYINSEHKVEMRLENLELNLNLLLLKIFFKKYKKFFNTLEKEKKFVFLKNIKQFFYNRNLIKYIYLFKVGSTKKKSILSKFYQKCIFMFLFKNFQQTIFSKKIKILALNFANFNAQGLIFTIPGLKESFFVPYTNIQKIGRKFSLIKTQKNISRKLGMFLPLDLTSFSKKRFSIMLHIWKKNIFLKKQINVRKNIKGV
jgi:hypothetical protein